MSKTFAKPNDESNYESNEESTEDDESSEDPFAYTMEDWKDKWWLTKRHKESLINDTDKSKRYICFVSNHGNEYESGETFAECFSDIHSAYDYVCDYLANKYNRFGGYNLSLLCDNHDKKSVDTGGDRDDRDDRDDRGDRFEYKGSVEDWRNVKFLLNYGSSSGPTPYSIKVETC